VGLVIVPRLIQINAFGATEHTLQIRQKFRFREGTAKRRTAMDASDIMTREIISVGPDTPVSDVVKTLLENRISAVPVVDNGAVVGIISEGDLLRRAEIGTERQRSRWLAFATSSANLAAEYVKTRGRSARDLMTKAVITVSADTPVAEIADILESRQIKRVPVLQDGRLVGIVSRANLIQALASSKSVPAKSVPTNDRKIREALIEELRQHKWMVSPTEANVIVRDGEVHLWGHVRSEAERKAILVAAKNVPGVRRVEDHMQYPTTLFF
jgi:CBS domain-containing protein